VASVVRGDDLDTGGSGFCCLRRPQQRLRQGFIAHNKEIGSGRFSSSGQKRRLKRMVYGASHRAGRQLTSCDDPVVGKHLGVNTRLLAQIYCCLRYVFRYKTVNNKCSSGTVYNL
jgi:hypothetical protein